MTIWAVVPVKPLDLAKSRLAQVLVPEQRSTLVIRLFEHTLDVLCGWEVLAGILVVSASETIWHIGEHYGVTVLKESSVTDLNGSLDCARADILRRNAEAMLIVPADIPGLSRPALEKVVRFTDQKNPYVVVAPDRVMQGTNIMFLSPANIVNFCYGPGSFMLHAAQAHIAGADFYSVFDPALNFDVDTPADFEMIKDHL